MKNDIQIRGGDMELSLRGKLGYIYRRIFPPVSWYHKHFPYLDKHPYMIVLFALRRLTVRAFGSRHRLKKELEVLGRLGQKAITAYYTAFRAAEAKHIGAALRLCLIAESSGIEYLRKRYISGLTYLAAYAIIGTEVLCD